MGTPTLSNLAQSFKNEEGCILVVREARDLCKLLLLGHKGQPWRSLVQLDSQPLENLGIAEGILETKIDKSLIRWYPGWSLFQFPQLVGFVYGEPVLWVW